ncbi:hypothetical protein LEP1GSC056_3662 [Leptospira borgpetersenii str. Brem 328]|uniref:Uncharacterized protein n=1 Tax=Leptospira borgpetersenii str. Brem 328 TaxID=1049780 RepID=A0ABC9SCH1_LEPBO|nr:hypothetical protein LEP1GSC056_3662 [Leptospira borgpetersenii str. Brem 328]
MYFDLFLCYNMRFRFNTDSDCSFQKGKNTWKSQRPPVDF